MLPLGQFVEDPQQINAGEEVSPTELVVVSRLLRPRGEQGKNNDNRPYNNHPLLLSTAQLPNQRRLPVEYVWAKRLCSIYNLNLKKNRASSSRPMIHPKLFLGNKTAQNLHFWPPGHGGGNFSAESSGSVFWVPPPVRRIVVSVSVGLTHCSSPL